MADRSFTVEVGGGGGGSGILDIPLKQERSKLIGWNSTYSVDTSVRPKGVDEARKVGRSTAQIDRDVANCRSSPRRTPDERWVNCDGMTEFLFTSVEFAFGVILCIHIANVHSFASETIWALLATNLAMVMLMWLKTVLFGFCICLDEFAIDSNNKPSTPFAAPVPRFGSVYLSLRLAAFGGLFYYLHQQVDAEGGSQVGRDKQFIDYCWVFLSLVATHVLYCVCEVANMIDAWAWTATKGTKDPNKVCVPLNDGKEAGYSYSGIWSVMIGLNEFFYGVLNLNAFAFCLVLAQQQYTGGLTIWAPATFQPWLLTTWIIYAVIAGSLLLGLLVANDKPCLFGHIVQGMFFYSAFFLFYLFCWNQNRLFMNDGRDNTYITNPSDGQYYTNVRWSMLLTSFLYFFLYHAWRVRCQMNTILRKIPGLKNVLTM
jgi:hypothetical protein